MLIPIIIATSIVGLVSLVGVAFIFQRRIQSSALTSWISLAAGSLLTVSLLDLLPEAIEAEVFEVHTIFAMTLGSMIFFFLFERVLHWHHCRYDEEDREIYNKKHFAYLNLIGDALHNFIDGFLIAGAFLLNWQTGVAVTLAVILHEIPQEVSDFGILLYSGMKRIQAIFFNFVIALTAVLGAVLFYFFGSTIEAATPLAAAFAAGNFLYLATADLIPELHREKDSRKVIAHSLWLLLGVAIIVAIGIILPHAE